MNDLTVNASDTNRSDNLLETIASNYVDLASQRIGGETIACSDDFFAEMENLLKPGRGIFIDDKYTDRGKWMDGWESRRSYGRDNGRAFDWCVIRLGTPGIIKGVDVDTNFFRGNAPAKISIEGCRSLSNPDNNTQWTEILTKHDTNAHSPNVFAVQSKQVWTHVRLNIFPDGGVARFRVYGEVVADWQQFLTGELIDVAAITNGGKALLCSDMFFSDKNNLIMPGRGKDMGDGWETKRRRDPGPDWIIIELAKAAQIKKVLIDTCHFKGNFPDTFKLEGANTENSLTALDDIKWQTIIDQTKLFADREQWFVVGDKEQSFTHVRLNIYPDGGVSRMRIMGYVG
jgi:allantoicase